MKEFVFVWDARLCDMGVDGICLIMVDLGKLVI